jgi:hypothetical protein
MMPVVALNNYRFDEANLLGHCGLHLQYECDKITSTRNSEKCTLMNLILQASPFAVTLVRTAHGSTNSEKFVNYY